MLEINRNLTQCGKDSVSSFQYFTVHCVVPKLQESRVWEEFKYLGWNSCTHQWKVINAGWK